MISGLSWHIHRHFLQGEMSAGADNICHPTTTSVSSYIINFTPLCSSPCLAPELRWLLVTVCLLSSLTDTSCRASAFTSKLLLSSANQVSLSPLHNGAQSTKEKPAQLPSAAGQLAALKASPGSPGLGTNYVPCCSTELRASTHSHSSCLTHGVFEHCLTAASHPIRPTICSGSFQSPPLKLSAFQQGIQVTDSSSSRRSITRRHSSAVSPLALPLGR